MWKNERGPTDRPGNCWPKIIPNITLIFFCPLSFPQPIVVVVLHYSSVSSFPSIVCTCRNIHTSCENIIQALLLNYFPLNDLFQGMSATIVLDSVAQTVKAAT